MADHIDHDKFLNDPEYRKQIRAQKNSSGNKSAKAKYVLWSKLTATPMRSFMFLLGGIFATGFIIALIFLFFLVQGLPSIQELENPRTDMASFVLSREGEILDTYFVENRRYVPINEISPQIINALVATEDHRFLNHWGMDMYRTLAIPIHILRGRPQGGSTISQQLARNLYRQIGQEFSVMRKFREMITAIQIERNYTKDEIIEMYLNTVEFSNSAFGIESASRTHFNKIASEIDIIQAATLIGTLQATSFYNPRSNPQRAQIRRNIVLGQMQKHGFLTTEELDELRQLPIELDYQRPHQTSRQSRYFGEYVRQQVLPWARENNYDIYRDGLMIYTTIDAKMQRHAERVMAEKIPEYQEVYEQEWTRGTNTYMGRFWNTHPRYKLEYILESQEFRNLLDEGYTRTEAENSIRADRDLLENILRKRTRLEGGFVAVEPGTGHVLAWVGGTDYSSIQRDNVYQLRRQAGSTFKPFVYALAIDNGYSPSHRFSRYPVSFRDVRGRVWAPNDMSISPGPEMVSLRESLARSLNNVTVRLLPELAGAPNTNRLEDLFPAARKIADLANKMGIKSTMEAVPAIALGTAEVNLLELVSSFGTFANNGVYVEPVAITRIEDREGNIIWENPTQLREEVISPETAYIIVDMLRGVIRGGEWGHGTGVRMRSMGINQDVGGKTGTSQNASDNWFVAMFPHVVAGAWVGGEDLRIRFPSGSQVGQGGRSALPIVTEWALRSRDDSEINWSLNGFEQPVGYIPFLDDRPTEPADTRPGRNRIEW